MQRKNIRTITNSVFVLGIILLTSTAGLFGQDFDLNQYDIYRGDTLIDKSDFVQKSATGLEMKSLSFKPTSDGQKEIYYLNGQLASTGRIKNKVKEGSWVFWHESGQKAREGTYKKGNRTGTHTYWFSNGNLRAVGGFKNDQYHGKWTQYSEDHSQTDIQMFKDGKLVE
jgi:antitoxin component YwqK of YwqJK toxin-antitoxin module